MSIVELINGPSSHDVGEALASWAKTIPGRIVRGDMMIGILSVEEVELVPAALRKAQECGVDSALLDLAKWLATPAFGDPDPQRARDVFREAIAAGAANASLQFAEFLWFRCRESTTADERQEAYSILKDLARLNHPRAMYLLGLLTNAGFGTAADPHAAYAIQIRASEMGDADAMFEMYIYCETGNGVSKDSEKAMELLRRAADRGHPRAMYNLAACLATGRGVPKDSAEAAQWYFRASEAGNVRATANLAMLYAKGEGVTKNLDQAKLLFDEADYMGFDVSDARRSVGL